MNQSVADIACKLRAPPLAATAGDIPVHPELGLNPAMSIVHSSARSLGRAKMEYQGVKLQRNIEVQFLHATFTDSEIFPFAHLPLCNCRLPSKKATIAFSPLILAIRNR